MLGLANTTGKDGTMAHCGLGAKWLPGDCWTAGRLRNLARQWINVCGGGMSSLASVKSMFAGCLPLVGSGVQY
jgi:hypothetical protein